MKVATYLRRELARLSGSFSDGRMLDEVETVLTQLRNVMPDIREEFFRHRKRLKELEEQEQKLTETNMGAATRL